MLFSEETEVLIRTRTTSGIHVTFSGTRSSVM